MIKKTEKKRLGDLLIEAGLITPEQLKKGLEEQKKTGERIGHTEVGDIAVQLPGERNRLTDSLLGVPG